MRMHWTLAAARGASAERRSFPKVDGIRAALLGRVMVSPHPDVAWLEPHRYCWVHVA